MKLRRHHNNTGYRQIKNDTTRKFVEYLKRKYKVKNERIISGLN